MSEKLLEMFQELLDICYEDERTDNDSHYSIEHFEDEYLAEEFESKLDEAMDYLNRYSTEISESFLELVGCGLPYEVCIGDTMELIELQA